MKLTENKYETTPLQGGDKLTALDGLFFSQGCDVKTGGAAVPECGNPSERRVDAPKHFRCRGASEMLSADSLRLARVHREVAQSAKRFASTTCEVTAASGRTARTFAQ